MSGGLKLEHLDKTNLWKELIFLEGQLLWDHKSKLLEVKLGKLRKPLLQEALQKFCYRLNQKKTTLQLGKDRNYQLFMRCE